MNLPEEVNHEDGMGGGEEMDHVENPSRAQEYVALGKERWCPWLLPLLDVEGLIEDGINLE